MLKNWTSHAEYQQFIISILSSFYKTFPKRIIDIEPSISKLYCLDLDIVGKNSLLAYLDKTQSKSAFIKLEHDLLNVTIEKDKIKEKQNAIQELASKIEWCIEYLTTAKKNESNYEFKFLSFDEKFKNLKKIIWLFSILNFITVMWFVFLPLSFYSISLLLFPISIYIIFYFLYKRKIKNQFKIANFSAKRVVVFQELLMIIEKENFSSKKLIELKIPEEQIKIKVSGLDELKGIDLMDENGYEDLSVNSPDICGRISMSSVLIYPPGMPVVNVGERITGDVCRIIKSAINAGLEVPGLKEGKIRCLR